jgi:membrane protease YdiL (CAAX protease family)
VSVVPLFAPKAPRQRRDRGAFLPVAAFVALACALLAARAWVAPMSGAVRPAAGAALFASVLVGSLVVPARRGIRRVSPAVATLVGLAALGGASAVAGTAVPLPGARWVLPLSLLAAVAEEALFRRVAYGHLERWGAVVAVVGSATLFAAVHLPLYGVAVLPVDLGAGLLFGWQRWATGSWVTPAATHSAANVVAVLR